MQIDGAVGLTRLIVAARQSVRESSSLAANEPFSVEFFERLSQ